MAEVGLDGHQHLLDGILLRAGLEEVHLHRPQQVRPAFGEEALEPGFDLIAVVVVVVVVAAAGHGGPAVAGRLHLDLARLQFDAGRPCRTQAGQGGGGAQRRQDECFEDGRRRQRAVGPAPRRVFTDVVGLREDRMEHAFPQDRDLARQILGVGEDVAQGLRGLGRNLRVGFLVAVLQPEQQPAQLVPEGGAQVHVGQPVFVLPLPVAEVVAGSIPVAEAHLLEALEIQIHGGVVRSHGRLVGLDRDAQAPGPESPRLLAQVVEFLQGLLLLQRGEFVASHRRGGTANQNHRSHCRGHTGNEGCGHRILAGAAVGRTLGRHPHDAGQATSAQRGSWENECRRNHRHALWSRHAR